MKSFTTTRRTFLKTGTAAAALIGFDPAVLREAAAQDADLTPYKSAKIDWQQTSGETITVAVIPASYFENLITLAPQFKALTGIDVRFEKIPPAQIRQPVWRRERNWGRTFSAEASCVRRPSGFPAPLVPPRSKMATFKSIFRASQDKTRLGLPSQ